MAKLKHCPRCCGSQVRCPECWKTKIDPKQERYKYLKELWVKAKKFNMPTVGSEKIDAEIIAVIGPWR